MKFRLIYDGDLPSGNQSAVATKHRIREQLHPQLKTLWEQHPGLSPYFRAPVIGDGGIPVEKIADHFSLGAYRFVPLVRVLNRMACRLEILLLMRQPPFRAFAGTGGDLDNRVKTLIDGLRRPEHMSAMVAGSAPTPDQNPFFCLLEDDKLVADFSVTTDRLLAPPRAGQNSRDIVTVISVHVISDERLEIASGGTFGFGFVR